MTASLPYEDVALLKNSSVTYARAGPRLRGFYACTNECPGDLAPLKTLPESRLFLSRSPLPARQTSGRRLCSGPVFPTVPAARSP